MTQPFILGDIVSPAATAGDFVVLLAGIAFVALGAFWLIASIRNRNKKE